MPALRGSLTYARYYVEGQLPEEDLGGKLLTSIKKRIMRPLEADDEELERSGWTRIGEPFQTDLAYDDVVFNGYVNLGFRTDRWALPAATLKRALREAEASYLEKKGRARITRREKNELKLLVAKKLKKSFAPVTRGIDLSWSLQENIVRFFSHAEKPGGLMMELFTKTFGLKLVPESPYTLAARIALGDADARAAWDAMEPSMIFAADDDDRAAAHAAEEE